MLNEEVQIFVGCDVVARFALGLVVGKFVWGDPVGKFVSGSILCMVSINCEGNTVGN